MFDLIPKLLSSVASFLFPLFASYKALKTSDPAQLTPWLMYWVVLACALLVESWTEWILVWVPFYSYIRLFFLLYLVAPQTQGARIIYQTHIHPYLQENETAIDDFIASAHDRMRAAGMAYLKQAIELFKTKVLNMPPEPEQPAQHSYSAAGASSGQSYTQTLLARFSLPAARWSAAPGTGAATNGGPSTDFYNMLAGAVSATLGGAVSRSAAGGGAGSSLIPSSVSEAEKPHFIATQRERLTSVLAALDREASHLAEQQSMRMNLDGNDGDSTPMPYSPSNPWDNGSSSSDNGRPSSGLSKSRSEPDFEKIDAESGTEDHDGVTRRRAPDAGTAGGSWLPFGWGGAGAGGDSDVGRSSGIEK